MRGISKFINMLFLPTTRNKHLREIALILLDFINKNQKLRVQEAKAICKHKKTYYKILRKLRSIGLVALTKEADGKFYLKLTLDTYKFFIRKHLIEEVLLDYLGISVSVCTQELL